MEIMLLRRVCSAWKEVARNTIVPPCRFYINSMKRYNAMRVMATALPNLQQIEIGCLCVDPGRTSEDSTPNSQQIDFSGLEYEFDHIYADGEDPDERRAARTARRPTHDIGIISNFSNLRILHIGAPLNGRYPVLFNSFPLLQKLSIYSKYLKWDLEMLDGMPLLKELGCENSDRLTGNISSLRVLKDTLEKVSIKNCRNVGGNFMDLADFPHLRDLDLGWTAVTGDIRDIGESDFTTLKNIELPKTVYGGHCYELQRISDAPKLVRAVYLLQKHRPALKMRRWCGRLSEDSPDWYESVEQDMDEVRRNVGNHPERGPPFYVQFVKAGSRIGYRWENVFRSCCEVNWLDPEPADSESSEYAKYIEELRKESRRVTTYRGFYQPPTEEEYLRLFRVSTFIVPLSDEMIAAWF